MLRELKIGTRGGERNVSRAWVKMNDTGVAYYSQTGNNEFFSPRRPLGGKSWHENFFHGTKIVVEFVELI